MKQTHQADKAVHSNSKSSSQAPLISIIVATYNCDGVLERCLKSIAMQTFRSFEVIVMDGGSTDGTVNIIGNFASNIAHWQSSPDRGIYHAWNKALPYAQGDWICFLGADDYLWSEDVLERMAPLLSQVPATINVAYAQIAIVSKEGKTLDIRGRRWEEVKSLFTQEMSIPHPGLMHRRRLFDIQGNYDESFRIAGDYELLLRELKTNDAVYLGDICVVGMQHGGASTVSRIPFQGIREKFRARRKNGITSIPDYRREAWYCIRSGFSDLTFRWLGDKKHRAIANIYRWCSRKPLR